MMNIYNITNKWWLVIVALCGVGGLIAMQRFCSIFIKNNNNFTCALRIAVSILLEFLVILKHNIRYRMSGHQHKYTDFGVMAMSHISSTWCIYHTSFVHKTCARAHHGCRFYSQKLSGYRMLKSCACLSALFEFIFVCVHVSLSVHISQSF